MLVLIDQLRQMQQVFTIAKGLFNFHPFLLILLLLILLFGHSLTLLILGGPDRIVKMECMLLNGVQNGLP